jgi:2-acylglycerol O-acyltransferase 2
MNLLGFVGPIYTPEKKITMYSKCLVRFFGTTECLTVVQDPFGILERISRKLKAGVMGFYGRWGLPVPRRVPLSLCVGITKIAKNPDPSPEELEKVHKQVYGNLTRAYEAQKEYAGYADRTLEVK